MILRETGWTHDEYLQQPYEVINELIRALDSQAEVQNRESQKSKAN